MDKERTHWGVGDKTRCGLPVMQHKRTGRYSTYHGPRSVLHYNDPVYIPTFLDNPNRCRQCAKRLREDTGLVSEMYREQVAHA